MHVRVILVEPLEAGNVGAAARAMKNFGFTDLWIVGGKTERTDNVSAWWAVGAVGLVAWGLRDGRTERINMGAAVFAATVFAFYFSEVMDKLGRSASLIGLGLLFLGGGWMLERFRRRLVDQARGGL